MPSSEMPSPGGGDVAAAVARQAGGLGPLVDALLARGDAGGVPEEAIQQGLTALVKLYAAQWEAGARFPPVLPDDGVSATAAMILVTALLQAVHVELFELGMWQAWSGR